MEPGSTYRFNAFTGINNTIFPLRATFFVVNSELDVREFSARVLYYRESSDGSGGS